jgi:hypothetical protein
MGRRDNQQIKRSSDVKGERSKVKGAKRVASGHPPFLCDEMVAQEFAEQSVVSVYPWEHEIPFTFTWHLSHLKRTRSLLTNGVPHPDPASAPLPLGSTNQRKDSMLRSQPV